VWYHVWYHVWHRVWYRVWYHVSLTSILKTDSSLRQHSRVNLKAAINTLRSRRKPCLQPVMICKRHRVQQVMDLDQDSLSVCPNRWKQSVGRLRDSNDALQILVVMEGSQWGLKYWNVLCRVKNRAYMSKRDFVSSSVIHPSSSHWRYCTTRVG
jgi:hypothetical protein